MHATQASNTSKAPASVTSKRESLAGRQTKTVQETISIPKGQIYTSNCQPLCGGRPSGPATNGHVHKPRGRQRRHNHRTQTSNRSIYKAISKDCRHRELKSTQSSSKKRQPRARSATGANDEQQKAQDAYAIARTTSAEIINKYYHANFTSTRPLATKSKLKLKLLGTSPRQIASSVGRFASQRSAALLSCVGSHAQLVAATSIKRSNGSKQGLLWLAWP